MLALRYDNARQRADLAREDGRLVEGGDLQTAVLISLYSDRLAELDDAVDNGDRRGWWGDVEAEPAADRLGSRLWLLDRRTNTEDRLARAREFAEESLRWLVEDGVAREVVVTATRSGERRTLNIVIVRADGRRWSHVWELTDAV